MELRAVIQGFLADSAPRGPFESDGLDVDDSRSTTEWSTVHIRAYGSQGVRETMLTIDCVHDHAPGAPSAWWRSSHRAAARRSSDTTHLTAALSAVFVVWAGVTASGCQPTWPPAPTRSLEQGSTTVMAAASGEPGECATTSDPQDFDDSDTSTVKVSLTPTPLTNHYYYFWTTAESVIDKAVLFRAQHDPILGAITWWKADRVVYGNADLDKATCLFIATHATGGEFRVGFFTNGRQLAINKSVDPGSYPRPAWVFGRLGTDGAIVGVFLKER